MSSTLRAFYRKARDWVFTPGSAWRRRYDSFEAVLRRVLNPGPARQYCAWLERHRLSAADLASMRQAEKSFRRRPLISLLTPVFDVDEHWLRRCIESVCRQVYPNWELCLVDDGSEKPHVARVLAEYATRDSRIHVGSMPRNSGITAATDRALAMARGEFVAFLDHDDEIAEHALFEVVKRLEAEPDLDFLYSDEDKIDAAGRRVSPFFKPDWSPDLLLTYNYMCHLAVYRRAMIEEVGGLRPGFDGAQDYDLILRVTERTQRIGHIPRILYHWRMVASSVAARSEAKPYADQAGRRVLGEALARRGRPGRVEVLVPGVHQVRYELQREPLVSILIPMRDRFELVGKCIRSIEERSTYRNREIVVVDNGSTDPAALRHLEGLGRRHRVIADPRPFNWSALNNRAAREAKGEILLFLNDDIQVVSPGFVEAMLEHAQRPEVGAVGARLLYPDGRVQHAGVVVGIRGRAGHAFRHLPGSSPGPFSLAVVVRNCSAVTGACMMVRRDVFESIGGFDESLAVAFNDVDFCLRLREKGLLVVYTPHAVLTHFECATRGDLHPPDDDRLFRTRWRGVIAGDPYYNPNLTLESEDFRLNLSSVAGRELGAR